MDKYVDKLTKGFSKQEFDEAFDEYTTLLKAHGSAKVTIETEITPAIAALLLRNFNTDNRKISANSVEKLANDMAEDRFEADNGQNIIISKEGYINDGQHRLAAIVKSGKTMNMHLALNRDRESRFTVDTGVKRSTGHILSLQGHSYGNTMAAAARRVIAYEQGHNVTTTGRISDNKVFERCQNDVLIAEVSQWAHTYQAAFKGLRIPPSEVATAFYLFSQKSPLQAKAFFESFRDGFGLSKGTPIATLRQKLLTSPKLTVGMRFELLVRAWNFWINDEKIDRFMIMGNVPEIKKPKVKVRVRTRDNADAERA